MIIPAVRLPRRCRAPWIVALAAAALLGACSQSPPNQLPGAPDDIVEAPTTPPTDGVGRARARVDSLEARARALANTSGCATLDQCAAAPMGAKPCGGPRTYLAYCRTTTDSVALFGTLQALETAERAYNEASGMASDCAMVMPPGLVLEGGACAARGPSPAGGM